VFGPLHFVDHGDGEVFHRHPALALRIGQQLILAETELAGALAWSKQRRRRKKRPVKLALAAQGVEEFAPLPCFAASDRRKFWRIDERFAGRDLKAAGPPDDQVAFTPDFLTASISFAGSEPMKRSELTTTS
jgi:hypothetical protein